MADVIHSQSSFIVSADTLSIFSISSSHIKIESGFTVPFNYAHSSQTASTYATSFAFSTFTLAHTHNQLQVGLTTSFSTIFVSTIVFDILATPLGAGSFFKFDPRGIPIIFSSIPSQKTINFYDRPNSSPAVFHSRGFTLRVINEFEDGIRVPFNRDSNDNYANYVTSNSSYIFSMATNYTMTNTNMVASFSTAVVGT